MACNTLPFNISAVCKFFCFISSIVTVHRIDRIHHYCSIPIRCDHIRSLKLSIFVEMWFHLLSFIFDLIKEFTVCLLPILSKVFCFEFKWQTINYYSPWFIVHSDTSSETPINLLPYTPYEPSMLMPIICLYFIFISSLRINRTISHLMYRQTSDIKQKLNQ